MSDPKPLRIGIIGAGGIVKSRHMPGLRAIPGVSITQVCNRSVESARAFCQEYAPEAEAVENRDEILANLFGSSRKAEGRKPHLAADEIADIALI